jgi:hypothetical protein
MFIPAAGVEWAELQFIEAVKCLPKDYAGCPSEVNYGHNLSQKTLEEMWVSICLNWHRRYASDRASRIPTAAFP